MKSHRSPLETIRAFCTACVGGHSKEVASCDGNGTIPGFMSCPFHPFRLAMERLTDACTCRFEERSC
jgi:hypothetical protein